MCQRPAHRCKRGVTEWDDQPGGHGNTAQVHVSRGQQARDDSADCGPAGVQEHGGREGKSRCMRPILNP